MDAKDRLFADIALRLQLLTREQVAVCGQHAERSPGKRLCDSAVELGLMSSDEAELCRAQRERVLERQQQRPPTRGGAAVLIEEAGPRRRDPRSASGPPQRVAAAAERPAATRRSSRAPKRARSEAPPSDDAPKPRKRGSRHWDAPTRPEQGLVRVAPAERPPSARELPAAPVSIELADPTPEAVAEQSTEQLVRAPQGTMIGVGAARAAEASSGRDAWSFDGFPLAQGDEIALVSEPPDPPPAQRPPPPPPATQRVVPATAAGRASVATHATPATPTPATRPVSPAHGTMLGTDAVVDPAPRSLTPPAHAAAAPEPVAIPSQPPPKASEQRPAAARATQDSYLGKALALAMRHGASDLHVHSGAPLLMRVDGQLRPLSGNATLSPEAAEKVIAEITTDGQWAQLGKKGEVDFACEIPGRARFRVNVYRQQRGLDAVFRIIPLRPPTLEQLGLPARLARLTDFRTGMVLCTGPAGCGKSTTLAALLNTLVQTRADHVLTVEDPVEFVFPQGRALCNQRQIGEHTGSFARALRAALREDPDIIAITELRDRDTISLAITAAETGHLVLGTLHTGNATQTIHRIVSSFPADEQEQVRVMLAESLRAVVSQRLVPLAAGRGRVPAVELLMVTTAVSNLIREDKTHQLPSVMQTGKAAGMMTLDDSLDELVSSGVIGADAARRVAVRKERFG